MDLKTVVDTGVDKLTKLMQMIWKEETIPSEWRAALLPPVLQRERRHPRLWEPHGNQVDIPHNEHMGEDQRPETETTIGEAQFGFMPGRSTTDATFALRLTMEKYRGKQKGLHLVFIDLEKAYD